MIYRIRIQEHVNEGKIVKEHLATWEEMKLLRMSTDGSVERLNTYIETKRDELPCMKYYWSYESNAIIEEGVCCVFDAKEKTVYYENDDVKDASSEKGDERLGRVFIEDGQFLVRWDDGEIEGLFDSDCYPIPPETADAYRRLRKEKDGIND